MPKINTSIPGLTIEFVKSGSRTYPKAIHAKSGMQVFFWNRAPLFCGKKEFVKRFDAAIEPLDIYWLAEGGDILLHFKNNPEKFQKFKEAIFEISIAKTTT